MHIVIIYQVLSLQSLIETLSPFQDAILAAIFVGFFVMTGFALVFRDKEIVVNGYLGLFFTIFVIVNVFGLVVAPFVSMPKFPENAGEGSTDHYIYVVDKDDNELLVDTRAIPPTGTRSGSVARYMIDTAPNEQQELGEYIIDQSNEYREYIESDPPMRRDRLEYPEHGATYRWKASDLIGINEFVAVRIYEKRIQFTDDKKGIESKSEELVIEVEYEG